MSNFKNWEYIILGALGVFGIGYGVAMRTKMAKVSERLDKSIDDLAGNTDIDISDDVVNLAVTKAADTAAKTAVEKATNDALEALKKDIRLAVSDAVEKEYENIKDEVLKKATEAAAKIDVARVRRDVERAAVTKYEANLDDILARFNDNLSNTSKIYSSIASAITRPTETGKEVVLKLT